MYNVDDCLSTQCQSMGPQAKPFPSSLMVSRFVLDDVLFKPVYGPGDVLVRPSYA